MEPTTVLYRERNLLVFWITLGCAVLVLGFLPFTPRNEWVGIFFTVGLLLFMGLLFILEIVVTPEEFVLKLALVWPFFRRQRYEIRQAEVYDKKWDGVNWYIRRIRDVEGQRGGKDAGVLLHCQDGDFWIQTRRGEELVAALKQW